MIGVSVDKSGKKHNSVIKRYKGRATRFIEFYIGKISEQTDETNDAWNEKYTKNPALPETWHQQGLEDMSEDDDGDLPF